MNQTGRRLLPALTMIALLVLWEALVRLLQIPLYVLPAPSQVILSWVSELGVLGGHVLITVAEAVSGMLIALLLALALGILMDLSPLLRSCLYPLLVVTQTVPMIVLAPIFIIYLGFGAAPKVLTVVLMCFFPIVVSFTDGMALIDPKVLHLVRSFGANRVKEYTLIKIPGALDSLFSGLRVAATYSISGAVVGEWVASQSGLGYYLIRVKNGYMLDKVFACVLTIILLSLLMNGVIRLLQRFFMPWKAVQYSKKTTRSDSQ